MLLGESMKRVDDRAAEILGKLGRMERILGDVVEGRSADCPRLFIITPAKGGPTVKCPLLSSQPFWMKVYVELVGVLFLFSSSRGSIRVQYESI